jgi:hypothetical protein
VVKKTLSLGVPTLKKKLFEESFERNILPYGKNYLFSVLTTVSYETKTANI